MPNLKADKDELILKEQLATYDMPLIMTLEKLIVLKQKTNNRLALDEAQMYAQQIIDLATKQEISKLTTIEDTMTAVGILKEAYTYRARENFEAFLIAMEWDRKPEERFYEPRQMVLHQVVMAMQELAEGKLNTLLVSMPPRAGKTTLGILYILWRAGRKYNKSILSAGYSSSLVNSFYDGCVEFVTSPEYRFTQIFPESALVASSAKNLTLDLGERKRYKTLTFRSIDGTVTGATEASELLYLDDLVSGIEEAMNPKRLESLWSKVSSDMLQRKKNGVGMLVIGTRWSIHDPIGRIETKYTGKKDVKIIRLPAVDKNGNSNIDYAYGVGFDTAHYKDLKSMTDTVTWECVYMQNPIERDGLLYGNLKRFFELPQDEPDDIFFFTDVAFGGEDSLSMPIAYQWGDDVYIADVVFMRGGYEATEAVVAGKLISHHVRRGVFEANNGGDFYGRDVNRLLQQQDYKCNIKAERAQGKNGKLSRIIQHAPAVLDFYFRDESLYNESEMYGQFMKELTTFVQTGKSLHDDAPDSLSGLATMLRKRTSIKPKFGSRRELGL